MQLIVTKQTYHIFEAQKYLKCTFKKIDNNYFDSMSFKFVSKHLCNEYHVGYEQEHGRTAFRMHFLYNQKLFLFKFTLK